MSVGVKQQPRFQPTCAVKCPAPRPVGFAGLSESISDGEELGTATLAPPAMRTRSKSVSSRPTNANKDAESDDSTRRQQAFRRRRFSSHSHLHQQRYERGGQQIRKRRHSAKIEKEKIVLPTKFLLGGNINDPLNLNGLPSDNTEQQTPVSSPLATPAHRRLVPVNVIIPLNITDPLNLNCDDDELAKLLKKKKRIKHHKKKDSSSSLLSETSLQDTTPVSDVTKPLSIQIDHDAGGADKSQVTPKPEISKEKEITPPVIQDKIVSPVIPQISPKRRRKRLSSEASKPDPATGTSRNIFREDSDPKGDTISPGNKYRRQHSGQSQDGHQNQQPPNKKSRHSGAGAKFIYGNYNRYYGYRNPELDEDSRLKCLKKEWFEGKSVLDIGCNVGHITLAIARFFEPNKIVGIDIDGKLIGAARKNIKYYLPGQEGGDNAMKFPSSMKTCFGPISKKNLSEPPPSKFPKNVLFKQTNYVLEDDSLLEMQKEEYDVVLALSITKWIHFNWGDDGLKRFFRRIGKQLRPGGILILEAQPWVSYKKKKKLNDTIFKNFQAIKFRPEHFRDYLLSNACGFYTCQFIDVPFNKNQGFRRPIQVFLKPQPFNASMPIEGRYSPMTPRTPRTPQFEREPSFDIREEDMVYPHMSPMQMPVQMSPMHPMVSRLQYRRYSMPCPLMPRNSWSSPALLSTVQEQDVTESGEEDNTTGHQTAAPCTITRDPGQADGPAAAASASAILESGEEIQESPGRLESAADVTQTGGIAMVTASSACFSLSSSEPEVKTEMDGGSEDTRVSSMEDSDSVMKPAAVFDSKSSESGAGDAQSCENESDRIGSVPVEKGDGIVENLEKSKPETMSMDCDDGVAKPEREQPVTEVGDEVKSTDKEGN